MLTISIDLTQKPLLHAVSFGEDCGGLEGLKPALFDNNAYFANDPIFFKALFAIPIQGLQLRYSFP
jgi:hypothetical protein